MQSGDGVTIIYDNPERIEQFFKTFNPPGLFAPNLCLSTGFYPGLFFLKGPFSVKAG
jgi:hypothetical protein